jgi:hypothetical protein
MDGRAIFLLVLSLATPSSLSKRESWLDSDFAARALEGISAIFASVGTYAKKTGVALQAGHKRKRALSFLRL